MPTLTINGKTTFVDVPEDTPLLWVIREHLQMSGTKFGCGQGLCGACTVHIDGQAIRSCITQVGDATGVNITTIEGLDPAGEHPLQQAWIEEQVPQCGYCQSGQIMAAAALLKDNPSPSDAQITESMTNLCRCMSYTRIRKAVHRAAKMMKA